MQRSVYLYGLLAASMKLLCGCNTPGELYRQSAQGTAPTELDQHAQA